MLVSGEQYIVFKLSRYLARDILTAIREDFPCVQILLEAAVVNAYRHVAAVFQVFIRPCHGVEGVGYAQLFHVAGLLPDVHKVRYSARYADTQPVCKRAHRPGPPVQFAAQIGQVCTHALGVHGVNEVAECLVSEVKVVVA